jgi:cholest-4-en-3-one 26-monooxygenase
MSTFTEPALAGIDLTTAGLFENGPPLEVFRLLREHDPVHWHPPRPEWSGTPDGAGFWCVTRAADIATVARDLDTYSVERGGFVINAQDLFLPLEAIRGTLTGMDPPRHSRYRALLQSAFTPHTVRAQTEKIRARVTRIIDAVIERGECDLARDIAVPLPSQVIGDLIGYPEGMDGQIYEWSERIVAFQDPEHRGGGEEEGLTALGEIIAFTNQLAEQRRGEPQDDLLSRLVHVEVEGQRFAPEELGSFVMQLLVAGNDTTRNALSGGMKALIERPDQWRALREDPSLIPVAVEEILRWVTPVYYLRRTATRDSELAGTAIREGDKVVQWYISGNHDPELNPDPDRFDVTRAEVRHLTFGGGGRRFCLGAGLSRLELRVALEELSVRMPQIELAGPVRWLRSNWFGGLTSMPVRFAAGARAG